MGELLDNQVDAQNENENSKILNSKIESSVDIIDNSIYNLLVYIIQSVQCTY